MFPKLPKPGKVRSRPSSVVSHTYDQNTGDLTVTFHHGKSYTYRDVPKEVAGGFREASSQGAFLHANIIGKFKHGD